MHTHNIIVGWEKVFQRYGVLSALYSSGIHFFKFYSFKIYYKTLMVNGELFHNIVLGRFKDDKTKNQMVN